MGAQKYVLAGPGLSKASILSSRFPPPLLRLRPVDEDADVEAEAEVDVEAEVNVLEADVG
jgi:hypothetical protein